MCARGGRLHSILQGCILACDVVQRDAPYSTLRAGSGTSTRSRGAVRVDREAVEEAHSPEGAELGVDDVVAHPEEAHTPRGAGADLLSRRPGHFDFLWTRTMPVKPSTRFINSPPCVLIPVPRPGSWAKGRGLRPRAPPSRFDDVVALEPHGVPPCFVDGLSIRTEQARRPLSTSKYFYPSDALFSPHRPGSFTA